MLSHRNIVRLYNVKKSATNLYLIMEFCDSGNLDLMLSKN